MSLDNHITKWLNGGQHATFFRTGVGTGTSDEEIMWNQAEWTSEHFELAELPQMPRVVPPENPRPRPRVSMAHDGGPGLRDGKHASRIKYLLREWL